MHYEDQHTEMVYFFTPILGNRVGNFIFFAQPGPTQNKNFFLEIINTI